MTAPEKPIRTVNKLLLMVFLLAAGCSTLPSKERVAQLEKDRIFWTEQYKKGEINGGINFKDWQHLVDHIDAVERGDAP